VGIGKFCFAVIYSPSFIQKVQPNAKFGIKQVMVCFRQEKKTVKECETACGAYDATKLNIMARASIFCWHTEM